jgi:phospholipase/lecithinase/hemolysin
MGAQVEAYLKGNPTITQTQLFALWGGGNDLRDAALANGSTVDSIKAAATTALANIKGQIAMLAAKGAKQFMWPNLPPLEKTPEAATLAQVQRDGLKAASELFRDQQAAAVAMLLKDSPGITIHTLDVHGEFLKIAAKPGDYGLTELAKGVVTVTDGKFSDQKFAVTANSMMQVDPDAYLFWDQIHPTARTHDLIAMRAFMMIPEPATVWLLAAALAYPLSRRRRR